MADTNDGESNTEEGKISKYQTKQTRLQPTPKIEKWMREKGKDFFLSQDSETRLDPVEPPGGFQGLHLGWEFGDAKNTVSLKG